MYAVHTVLEDVGKSDIPGRREELKSWWNGLLRCVLEFRALRFIVCGLLLMAHVRVQAHSISSEESS
jgi:hypothetical protein